MVLTAGLEQHGRARVRVCQPTATRESAQSRLVPKRLAPPNVLCCSLSNPNIVLTRLVEDLEASVAKFPNPA